MRFLGEMFTKNQKRGLPKKGGFGQFADLRGGLARISGVKLLFFVFFLGGGGGKGGGGGDTPMHIMI